MTRPASLFQPDNLSQNGMDSGRWVTGGDEWIASTSSEWSKALISVLSLLMLRVLFHRALLPFVSFSPEQPFFFSFFFVWTAPPVWDYKDPALSWTESIMMLLGRNAKGERWRFFVRIRGGERSVAVYSLCLCVSCSNRPAPGILKWPLIFRSVCMHLLKCPEVLLTQKFQLHLACNWCSEVISLLSSWKAAHTWRLQQAHFKHRPFCSLFTSLCMTALEMP